MANFTNADGLTRHYGPQGTRGDSFQVVQSSGGLSSAIIDFSYDEVNDADGNNVWLDRDASGGSTPDTFSRGRPVIPARSVITRAILVARTAWAGGTTLDIGLAYDSAGTLTEIDYDGIFDAIVTADLLAYDVSVGSATAAAGDSGPLVLKDTWVSGTPSVTTGANDAMVYIDNVGTFTAGSARLFLEWLTQPSRT